MFTHSMPEVVMEADMLSIGIKIQGMKYLLFARTVTYKCKYFK